MPSLPSHSPLRAAVYVRVSSAKQTEGTSLTTQAESCQAHAAEIGAVVEPSAIFREVFSGTELWQRPQLTLLRDSMRRGEVDVLICHSIDRLSRDQNHLIVLLTEAQRYSCRVVFVIEPLDDSPEGEVVRYLRGWAAKV